jgi:hypothetical protein
MIETTINPEELLSDYDRAFEMVYDRPPSTRYLRDGWYRINGETVHHTVLATEVDNLRDLARRQRMRSGSKSAIRRLIDKLRLL